MNILDFIEIGKKWQKKWEEKKVYETNIRKNKKFFTSIVIPYVNGNIHIGHSFTYARTDSYARFKRMMGFNVLLAQGFHATGEPILGVIERLKKCDDSQIQTLKMYGASDKDIENFIKYGPEYAAKFWSEKIKESMKYMGFAIDWRRTFITAIDDRFSRFIEWQYNTFKEKGYVVQGTHPVVWCPKDSSPTGDHDRLYGEGESPQEYVILKFRLDDEKTKNVFLPCGTLRPETIYGVTNIWIREDVEYLIAKVDGEKWLLSNYAAEKLKDQLKSVEIVSVVNGHELLGKKCFNPVTNNPIPILPADFVDTDSVTGVVMSVPAHAPFDWIAIKELLEKDVLEKYGITKECLEPIQVVKTDGFSGIPAVILSEKMKILSLSQKEELEKATSELYKKEFYEGRLLFGEYAGKTVEQSKEKLVQDFKKSGIADVFWEVAGVVCRCTTKCHVKILENQWFLKYSDEVWKSVVRNHLKKMNIYPEDVRNNFENTIDWLKDKACARKSGLGTRLPWDKEWIIETLSDSTIYMAYYTISKIINEHEIKSTCLTDAVFDYIFFGKGTLSKVAKSSGLKSNLIFEMKKEFEYFYPIDLRNSAKDLIQNHLTFFLFHHAALWPEKFSPKAISINGYVNIEGEKMSKSKGNIIPLFNIINQFGPDLVRINIVSSTEGIDDADWRVENIKSYRSRLDFIHEIILSLKNAGRQEKNNLDKYIISKVSKNILRCIEEYEKLNFRSAIHYGFFENINELKWYVKRCEKIKNCNRKVLESTVISIIKVLAPITPHFSEEMWSLLGNKNFIINEKMPIIKKSDFSTNSEMEEDFIKNIVHDVFEIQKIAKINKISKVSIFISPGWKFYLLEKIKYNKKLEMSELIKKFGESDKNKIQYIQQIYKKINELREPIQKNRQNKILKECKSFLKDHLNCEVEIVDSENSDDKKAMSATPNKPGIKLL